jgi:adenylate cyclase
VVLPFTNLSGDPKQDYFADGITENLTTDLSRIRNSFVIAQNTAFTYKGKNIEAKEIGKELGVRYVLEGSVQHDGNRVRVNAQLIDAEKGEHLWADRFEENLADLFKLQDEIVARLANSLGNELTRAEADRGTRSKNPDVIDLHMRGRALLQHLPLTEENNNAARAAFERALKIAPNDAGALTGDAGTYLDEICLGWENPATDYETKVLGQTDRAIALAPDYGAAYYVKSLYLSITRRANEALAAADAGLAVDPNSARLYLARANAENFLDRYESGKADVLQAMRLSPRDPRKPAWQLVLGLSELGLRNYDAARDDLQKAVDAGYRASSGYEFLAAASALVGKMEEATANLAEARRLNPKLTVKWLIDRGFSSSSGLVEGLRKAGLPEE